jgi:deazaflavin-dependent oxidoreductase (nitroreductase family)
MTETRLETRSPGALAGSPGMRSPWLVRASNPLTRRLLGVGVPMGPNGLLTVRGRTSGLPRTAPVAIAEIDGRRYVVGAYGNVHWVRNLRAAGEATVRVRGHNIRITATELNAAAARTFFAATLPGYVARLPRLGRAFVGILFRLAAPEILRDPAQAAAARPVFELHLADTPPA